jgi:HD-GYP domain-containing protein (c-di-GMP phosphodiesterase class II)
VHARPAAALAGLESPRARTLAERALERAQMEPDAGDMRHGYSREVRHGLELEAMYLATVRALAAAVEAKDDSTGGHIHRVHELGLLLAREVAPEMVDDPQLAYGFLLHDIGKLAVPDAVLTKPGKLDEEEWEPIRGHPEAGGRILAAIPFLDGALDIVLHHHERWDGRGYPHGLAGEAISLAARIFAVVDTVDAITSDRPYRAGRPLAAAMKVLGAEAGKQFDPACVDGWRSPDEAAVGELLEHRPAVNRPTAFAHPPL